MYLIKKLTPYCLLEWIRTAFRIKCNVLLFILIALLSGCKSSTLSIADNLFQKGEYHEAQKLYRENYNRLKDKSSKADIANKLGQCSWKLNQYQKAINYFLNALRNGCQDSIVYLYLSDTYLKEDKIKDAEFYIHQYNDKYLKNALSVQIENSLNFINNAQHNTRYHVEKARFINNRRSNYSPTLLKGHNNLLYFTSTDEYSKGDKSTITGIKHGDIWYAKKNENNEWERPQPLEGPINTNYDEGTVSFTPDGNRMYFTRSIPDKDRDTHLEIWYSNKIGNQWDEPSKLTIFNDSAYNYCHPAVSTDGLFLYFASDRPGGYGGYDIWRTLLTGDNGIVENLGDIINTPGDEVFPYLHNDSTIYFASYGHPGYGGLDIFKAFIGRDNKFYNVWNMGRPINSSADDFGITFNEDESGFFSSNRNDDRGYDHIFMFKLPNLRCLLTGYVLDTDGYAISNADLRLIGNDGTIKKEKSKDDGSFRFNIIPGISYLIQASCSGFLNISTQFTSDLTEEDSEYNVDFTLVPVNRPVIISNIYYDFDSYTLRPDSKLALDSLIQMMNEYSNISIRINSHTDRVGSDKYNFELSKRRAQSVVNYLASEGKINSNRLTSIGYGKTKPVKVTPRIAELNPQLKEGIELTENYILSLPPELQDQADQINRRTEFEITSIDYNLY